MKIFTQVNRSQGMIRTLVGLKSRITSTKPLLTMLALLMVALFGVSENAWGADCNYTLSGTPSGNITVVHTRTGDWYTAYTKYYNFPTTTICTLTNSYGITAISFSMRKDGGWNNGDFKLQCYTGSSWEDAKNSAGNTITWNVKNENTTNVSATIDPTSNTGKATQFRVVRTTDTDFTSSNRYFTISSVTVKMAKSMSGNTDALTFSNQTYGTTSSAKTKTFTFSNEVTGKSISITSNTNSTEFPTTISKTGDCTGSVTVSVQFKPSAQGTRSGSITVSGDCGSKTFSVSGTGVRANSSIEMKDDGNVNVSISGINTSSIDLSSLQKSKTGNGNVTYSIRSATGTNATTSTALIASDGKTFSATECGVYTIRATQAQTDQYNSSYDDFTVTVNKLQPTFTWALTGTDDHIYAGNVLTNLAQAKYGNTNVNGLTYSYTSGNTGVVVVDEDKTTLRVQSTGFNTAQTVRITVNTAETDYYAAGSGYHDYYIEPKQTPEFYMNGNEIPTNGTELHLKIGETANFSFDKIDESNFSTPQNPQYVSYVHNSTNHSGVLTATAAGDETVQFSQTGTTLINAGSRSVHVYVTRHAVNLATTLDGGTWKVDSVYTGAVYSITEGDGVHNLNEVSVTSSDETVLKKVDGDWKAVGAGTATLTISHANTNYWASETVYAHITVEKYTPEFAWHVPATVNWNRTFAHPVSSTNEDEGCTFSYSSNNTSAINYVNGALRTYEKNATNVGITVTQLGNYKWAEKSQTFYVNVEKMANHVEFTVNSEALYNAVNGGTQGSVVWNGNNGIRLGGSATGAFDSPAWDWGDKYIDIAFEGVPKKISFSTGLTSGAATATVVSAWGVGGKGTTNGFWYVIEYSKTGAAHTVWSESDNSNPGSKEFDLLPSTNKVRVCYTGNFAGYVKNLKITERTEITGANTVDFGEADASSDPTQKTTKINWYNVNPLTLTIEGTNASQFTVSQSSIASSKDSYAENVSLTLTYKHNRAAVKDTATLVISDGTTTKRIGLRGVTNKITPAITWKENLTPMQRGVNEENPATSPVTLTYSSTNPEVVAVDGSTLKPLKKGTATITASFDGTNDGVYNSTTSTIDVEVTDVKVQHINWTQNFKRLKWTNDAVLSSKNTPDFPLVATVSYYDADLEQEITIDRSITFTSNNTNVVQVLEGNILHVVGIGTTTLCAHVDGVTDELFEANAIRDVVVREPSLDCESWVLDNQSGSIAVINEVYFDLNGEADSLYFDAWREIIHIVFDFSDGDLYVAEVYEDGSEKVLWNNATPLNTPQSYKCPLSRNAKKVHFYTQVGATGYHNFDGVYARRARYVEFEDGSSTKNIAFTTEDAKPGVAKTKSFKVNYSNITDQLEFEFKGGVNSKFSVVSPSAIGTECGNYGQATVTVQFLSNDVDTYKDTLLIHNLNQSIAVYLQAEVDRYHQQITWNPATTDLKTTDNVTFDATTTGSAAGLGVTYHVTAGSDVATVNETTGELTIIKDGSVTIEARAVGNDSYYDATMVSKTFTISKVDPIITAPTAATMTLPNTRLGDCLLTGGSANVAGSFVWEDEDIYATLNNSGYNVIFTPENPNWYSTTNCVVVVPVVKQANVITWNFDVTEMYCNAMYAFTGELAATATSGLAVRYESSDASIAYVDDSKNLKIVKGGTVTITAYQDGNGEWEAAEPIAKELTIHRFAPVIVTSPSVAPMKIGRLLSDASLTGGRVELDSKEVEGGFAWEDGNTTVMDVAGTFEKKVIFTPSNSNYYEPVEVMIFVEVEKYAPVLSNNTLSGATITYGEAISMSTINGSITATDVIKLPNVEVSGHVEWKNASTTYPNAGEPSFATAVFVPENNAWYNEVEIENVPLTVNKAVSDASPSVSAITYGATLGSAVLTNNGSTAGTWRWNTEDNEAILNVGEYTDLAVHFTPSNNNFIQKEATVALTVNPAMPDLTWTVNPSSFAKSSTGIVFTAVSEVATAAVSYSITAGETNASIDAATGELTILAAGDITVQASLAALGNYSARTITTNATIIPAKEYSGTGIWETSDNWYGSEVPMDEVPDVLIKTGAVLTIDREVTVGSLTIEDGSTVLIVENGKLNVNGVSENIPAYGDIHVKKDGELTLTNSANLKVNDFILDAKLGNISDATPAMSGQVSGEAALTITGDAYFELTLDPSGMCSAGWYTFTVPFPVDAMTGITRINRNTGEEYTIVNERNYAIMDFSESRRVETGYGWKKYRGILQPGKCYTMTIDSYDPVYRFKKTETGAFNNKMSETLDYSDVDDQARGWNGLGNGTMSHIDLSAEGIDKVQIYNHSSNSYFPADIDEFTYVVGASYFVQAKQTNSVLNYSAGTKDVSYYRAPQRNEDNENTEFKLSITPVDGSIAADRLYVGASADAINSYEIGHDLTKFGTPTDSKVAQIWANAYDLKLCDIEMPLVNSSANCEMGLYAPNAGSYTLEVERAPENTMLYLTYNGRAIWNLTYSPYVIDLTKGTTEGYGLKMYVMQVATDVETVIGDQNSVRKVLIDDVIYIVTPEGKMYDITGKSANY